MAKIPVHMAPLQGFTEAPYRLAHAELCGGVSEYYTPFIRYEHGEVRRRDIRDITLPDSTPDGFTQVPQLIAGSVEEFDILCSTILSKGYTRIDLNMGCPFHLQTGKGKGAGLLGRPDTVKEIISRMNTISDTDKVRFSIKMRLGMLDPNDWKTILPIINDSCIGKVTIHPRIAKQQYKGDLFMESFSEFYSECSKPLCYNGDILSVEQIDSLIEQYPGLDSVMIGRGLLSRPTLAKEYLDGTTCSDEEVREIVLSIHEKVYSYYKNTLEGGSGQILQKIQPFWEYQEPLFGHKFVKNVMKVKSIKNYEELIDKA